jgi:hypothetical protein
MERFRKTQEKILLNTDWRIYGDRSKLVSGLGTVLANDEIVNGVSERGDLR